VPARWYAFAIIGVPLTACLVAFALSGSPDQANGSMVPSAILSGLLLQLVVLFLTINWFEEVAWMGFVQARLQDRYGPMRAAVVGGALFALGHISMFVGQAPSTVAVVMTSLIVVAIPFRALLAWVYNRTGSLVLVGLIHAAGNATALGSVAGAGLLPRLYPGDRNGDLVIPILAVLGVLVILATRARLGYPGGRTRQGRREASALNDAASIHPTA
jgi:membrane protease YdiL (CAAX protease family)